MTLTITREGELMEHIPIPWKVLIRCGNPGVPLKRGGGKKVFVNDIALIKRTKINGEKRTLLEVKANAHLIAAAPELLLACKEACVMLKEIADEHNISALDSPGFKNILKAISHAEGAK
jgi:hypothetical protein